MSLSLTNAQIANLIDALRVAIGHHRVIIQSETPPSSDAEAREHALMNVEMIRWRALKKLLLEHDESIVPRPTAEADDALGVPREWREKHNDGGSK